MTKRNPLFGQLLTEAVKTIHVREGKRILVIHDELGYSIGKEGGAMLYKWREGHIPSHLDLEKLAEQIIKRTDFDRTWLEHFLTSARYPSTDQLCDELFGQQRPSKYVDWGEAPMAQELYGRQKEMTQLTRWTTFERYRLISILGLGGIGKTVLSKELAQQVQNDFEYIKWVTLKNGPPLESILNDCIFFLSEQRKSNLPQDTDSLISLFIRYLSNHRCLVILDTFESTFKPGESVGQYLDGLETYGDFLIRLGNSEHQSCIILTSREKPKELAYLSSSGMLTLTGIESNEAKKLLHNKGLTGSDTSWNIFVEKYAGNPLMLQIASELVRDLFEGDISRFLAENTLVFGEIQSLLDHQLTRLLKLEQDIMYWLAIEQDVITIERLRDNLLQHVTKSRLLETLSSLQRRHLINQIGVGFTQLDPVMEYMTRRFVDTICDEIINSRLVIFNSHSLIKAATKKHIRQAQTQYILEPITTALLEVLGDRDAAANHLMKNLISLRTKQGHGKGYAAGNSLNLLIQLKCDLNGYDFSKLNVHQADLRGVTLHGVNFTRADLKDSVFTESFDGITSIDFSPDGKLLAAGTPMGTIHLWRTNDRKYLSSFEGHGSWVRSVTFSPNGLLLASGGSDNTLRLWKVNTGECTHILTGHNRRVRLTAFSPTGNIIASASSDKTIRLWDVNRGTCINELKDHKDVVWSVAFNPVRQILASGSYDGTVKLWDSQSGKCLRTLIGHEERVWEVAFNPTGNLLASSSSDKTIRLWGGENWDFLVTLEGHTDSVVSLAFSPGGRFLASASNDHTVRLWNLADRSCERILPGHIGGVNTVAFHPNGETLASGGADHSIRIWEVKSGKHLHTLQGYINRAWIVAFHPGGNILAVSGTDPTIRLWSISDEAISNMLAGHGHWVEAISFAPDGKKLVSCGSDKTVRLWETASGKCLRILREHSRWVSSVIFSPDGQHIASGAEDNAVCLWNIQNDEMMMLQEHTNSVRSVAFSRDSVFLASSDDDGVIRLWSVPDGRLVKAFQKFPEPIWTVDFSSDKKDLAFGSHDHIVRILDINTDQLLMELTGHTDWITTVLFSPDSKVLASASSDQTVRLWEVESWKLLHVLETGTQVWSISFDPEGNALATGSNDETVKIWDVHSGKCIKQLRQNRPYEGMNITGATGITDAQRNMLRLLGAVEA